MAVRDPFIGVGPALRKARERRGITIDAASRDTKLRVDQLRALEDEDFSALAGEVYVRGSLRTYAQYLGLSADKVVGAYAQTADDPAPPPPPAKLGRVERALAATRIRDNQRFIVIAAATVLLVAVVFGFFSRGHSAPAPAALPTVAAEPQPTDRSIDAVVRALQPVQMLVTADGLRRSYDLLPGETRTFTAESSLVLEASDGGALRLSVAGKPFRTPGAAGVPWRGSYSYETASTATP